MSPTNAMPVAAGHHNHGLVIPMFVCAGCRPEPLGYTSIEYGDGLDEMVTCPMRDVCTWHAAHDFGGECHFNEQPETAQLAVAFKTKPYFSCRNFHDHAAYVAGRNEPHRVAKDATTTDEITPGRARVRVGIARFPSGT